MADSWEALKQSCMACRACGLAETRTHVVFGDGAQDAEILLIGEGPGQHEDEQGVPFVGRGGQLLNDMLEMIGLDRTNVYIANVVKCRPPQNRDPLHVEQEACLKSLCVLAGSQPKPSSRRTSKLPLSMDSGLSEAGSR